MSGNSIDPINIKESYFLGDEEALDPEQDLFDAEKILKKYPNDVYGMLNKGVALGRLKRFREAAETLEKAKDFLIKKNTAEAQGQAAMMAYNLACFLDQAGNEEKAEQEFYDAIYLGTESKVPGGMLFGSLAAYDLGIDHQRKKHTDSDDLLMLSIDLGKTSNTLESNAVAARSCFNLANSKLKKGITREFEELLKDSIQLGRSSSLPRGLQTAATAAIKLGIWYGITGRDDESRLQLKEATHIGRSTNTDETNFQASIASDALGDNLRESELYIEALAAYQRAIEYAKLSKKDQGIGIAARAYLHSGMILDKIRTFNEAKPAYEESLKLSKDAKSEKTYQYGAASAFLLGTGFAANGETEEAKNLFEESIRLGEISKTEQGTRTAKLAREYLSNY